MAVLKAGATSAVDNSGVDDDTLQVMHDGTVTSHTATRVVETVADGKLQLTLTGTDLGHFDEQGLPHSGTITGMKIVVLKSGLQPLSITQMDLPASTLIKLIADNNSVGFV